MTDWRRFRLMAVDVDGTLAGADHQVTDRTIAALSRAERAGLRTVLVTGRFYPSVLEIWNRAGLSAPIIVCGGALILQPPDLTVLHAFPIPNPLVEKGVRIGEELDLDVSLWTERGVWVTRPGLVGDLLTLVNGTPTRVIEPGQEAPYPFGPVPVLKVLLGGPAEQVDRVAQEAIARLAPLYAARSMPEFVEATLPEASKGGALQVLLDRLGIDPSEVIAMGDAETDVGMLSLAGMAVVPANAMPAAKAVADRVIGHHDQEGVAAFVEEILRLREAGD